MKQFSILLLMTFLFLSCFGTDNEDEEKEIDNGDENESSLVDTATNHYAVTSFSPEHNQENVSKSTTITIQFSSDISLANKQVHVEVFGFDNSKENCRMSMEGIKCGDLSSPDSWKEMYGYLSEDSNNGLEVYGEVVFGDGIVSANNSLTMTFERDLIEGITYVVHVFYDEDGSNIFRTWWLFKT